MTENSHILGEGTDEYLTFLTENLQNNFHKSISFGSRSASQATRRDRGIIAPTSVSKLPNIRSHIYVHEK